MSHRNYLKALGLHLRSTHIRVLARSIKMVVSPRVLLAIELNILKFVQKTSSALWRKLPGLPINYIEELAA